MIDRRVDFTKRQGAVLTNYSLKFNKIALRNPKEGHQMFNQMITNIQEDVVRYIYRVNLAK